MLTITAVELVLQNLARVLLGLLGGVGVVEVSLVATSDLGIRRHVGGVDLVKLVMKRVCQWVMSDRNYFPRHRRAFLYKINLFVRSR